MQELVKLSLICGSRSIAWTEPMEHVAEAPRTPHSPAEWRHGHHAMQPAPATANAPGFD